MDLFPQTTIKLLIDKSADRRQQGLKDIESALIIALKNENYQTIKKTIDFFAQWVKDTNYNQKKYGQNLLFQITQFIMREGGEDVMRRFVVDVTRPLVETLEDKDEKIRLNALDNLQQISKKIKEIIMVNFNEIFEAMLVRAADPDETVRKHLYQFDNQLKNNLNEAGWDRKYFNIEKFVTVLQQRMKVKTITQVRSMLISWVKCLHQLPGNDMFIYLPQLLEGLFIMLGDPAKEIRSSTDHFITELFKDIEHYAKRPEQKITEQIIDILITICFKGNNFAKLSAVLWIFEYLRIFQQQIDEDYQSSKTQFQQSDTKESTLKKTILPKIPFILEPILQLLSHEEEEIRRAAQKTNDLLLKIMDKVKYSSIEFMNVVPIVKDMLTQKNSTAESALVWMNHLLRTYSEKLLPTIDNILGKLIEKLNDAEGTVLQNVMEVLGSISLHEQYFDLVIDKILTVFNNNREILTKRSDLIIKKLCSLLNPEKVYSVICSKLVSTTFEIDFISQVVQTLDIILVTERDLQDLRQVLRNLRYEESKKTENLNTFQTLFYTFSYNPVSTITLCFLAEEYELAYNIIISFADVEIDMDTLMSIAKLVNMLESAIFVYLRLQLLEHEKHPFLLKSLQGLMMLLPQGVAFSKLKQRLKNVKQVEQTKSNEVFIRKVVNAIDTRKLLEYFCKIRQKVMDFKRDQENQANQL